MKSTSFKSVCGLHDDVMKMTNFNDKDSTTHKQTLYKENVGPSVSQAV